MSTRLRTTALLFCVATALSGCGQRAPSTPAENPVPGSQAGNGADLTPTPDGTDPGASETIVAGGPEDYDYVLKKYVDGDYFDYAGLKQNPEDLARFEAFLQWQAEADVSEMSREDQIAFYINAYNSCSIKAVLDHYPVHTPMDIDGFFDKLTFKVGGEMLKIGGSDGDSIEYDRLIANYKDMRAHFAVVCADRGCLALKPGAYTGESLDEDLEAAAQKFVADERHFKVDPETKELHVSKIFEWYGPKFLQDPDRPVEGDRPELYLMNWIKDDETRMLLEQGDYQRKIIEWSWTLNEK